MYWNRFGSFLVIATMVTSCATPGDLAGKSALLDVASQRPVADVVSCLATTWGDHSSQVSVVPVASGSRVLILHSVAGTDALAEVVAGSNGGSQIRYTERAPSLSPAWMRGGIESCR